MSGEPEIETRVVFKHDSPLDLAECYEFVRSPHCGAINLFAGTIRDDDIALIRQENEEPSIRIRKQIKSIYYEAYESMAERQIRQIITDLSKVCHQNGQEFFKAKVCVELRLGHVPVGEAAIIICVSSVRRNQSNSMVMSILNQIKSNVVIWKKIFFADGTEQWDLEEKSEATWMNKGL